MKVTGSVFQRIQQPIGMIVLQIPFDPLRAQLAAIEWELFPRFEANDLLVFDQQRDATLLPTKTTVRVDLSIGRPGRFPSASRLAIDVRTVLVGKEFKGVGWFGHVLKCGVSAPLWITAKPLFALVEVDQKSHSTEDGLPRSPKSKAVLTHRTPNVI
jgi:hypothetical protein